MSRYRTLAIITSVILVFDQATKLYVDANFRLHESVPVIRGFFHLTYVRNKVPPSVFSPTMLCASRSSSLCQPSP
jgi:hypothetical protein